MTKPDFLIIGAMKAGTTSLYAWMADQPEFALPADKESGFFTDDRVWSRGLEWYTNRFPQIGISGEASVSYTLPNNASRAARRIHENTPDAKLVFVARHPLDRTRSHYRHELQRGREKRTFIDAIAEPQSPYVRASCYFSCLKPFFDRFDEEQICVVRTEDLSGSDDSSWNELMAFLGLPPRPKPRYVRNESQGKRRFSRPFLKAWETGLVDHVRWVPRPIRQVAKKLLTRIDAQYKAAILESEGAPFPPHIERLVWDDISMFEGQLGRGALWPRWIPEA